MFFIQRFILLSLCLLLVACDKEQANVNDTVLSGDYAFMNVSVVPMTSEIILQNQTVIIKDDKITHILNSDNTLLSDDIQTIDGTGKFLAPGLSDMHVHLMQDLDASLYVAYGVTTVRNMWGYPATLAMREKISQGDLIGPTIFTSGPLTDGPPKIWPTSTEVSTPEEAVSEIANQLKSPYDFVKVYSHLSPELFYAIADAAKAAGRPFAGHVPDSMTIRQVISTGMKSMEHMIGFDAVTLAEGIDMGARRTPERRAFSQKILSGEYELDQVFEQKKIDLLAMDIAKSDTWTVPTLIVHKKISLSGEDVAREFNHPEMEYVSPALRDFWNPANDFRRQTLTEEDFAARRKLNQMSFRHLRALQKAGAKILTGSDAPNPFVFHGLGLHEELELFVQAGLSPYEAIQASTTSAAAYFDQAGLWGQVSPGVHADLVLLSANPLENVKNYLQIKGIMLRGKWLDSSALKKLRAEIAQAVSQIPKDAPMVDEQGGFFPHVH